MGLFTPKRRKSAAQDTAPRQIYETPDIPTPIFARHQQTSNGVFIEQKSPNATMEMPDLRFSKLDLDIDMNKFKGGPETRPGSIIANGEERRKSKMALFNFNGNSRTSLTTTEENMIPARKSSTPNTLTDASSVRSNQTSRRNTPMEQDRKKLVASATEAMSLDVPVKAPLKGPSPLSAEKPAIKTKKELKKEEKERAAREKAVAERERAAREKARANFEREKASRAVMEMDKARQAAREAAESSRKEEQMARRISNMDMYAAPAKKRSVPDLRPMTADQRKMLNASANNVNPLRGPPNNKPEERSRSKSPAPSSTSSRRPPSLPPSQRPPPPPISNRHASAKPQNQPRQDSAAPAAKSGSFQFPRQPGGPIVHRSQSAIPAADGVPRPVVVRGQTGSEAPTSKSSGGPPQIGSFGVPMTSSPPMHSQATFTSSRTGNSSYRSPQKMARGSSSDERSSTSADGPSMESNTSIEDNDLINDPNERYVDASSTFARRPRPRRDEEREERAQSRLSGHFDSDGIRCDDHYHTRTDSSTDKFAALLAASRPGGAGDRSADAAEVQGAKERMEVQRQRYLNQAHFAVRPPPPPPQPIKRIREVAPRPKRNIIVRPELVDQGVGWSCQGVGDLHPENTRERTIVETINVPKIAGQQIQRDENGNEVKPEMVEQQIRVRYNDLFELIWTSTTPDVISRLISHLDISDLKALRQTSHSIRFTLDYHDNREMILNQHLACIGYRTWSPIKGAPSARTGGRIVPSNMSKDPCPLSFNDCEAFLISHDLLPEYAAVGQEYAARAGAMDPRMARLAQASTRAYSRVLTRLRLQPVFKVPKPSSPGHAGRIDNSSSGLSATPTQLDIINAANQKHNSYYPLKGPTSGRALALQLDGKSPSPLSPADSGMAFSPIVSSPLSTSLSPATMNIDTFSDMATQIKSPWKPGRAAFYRVWVPASDPNGWLIDAELTECESQLYKAGIWNFLKKGDVVWDTAVGDQVNEGKYIFDGHYLRDLSYAHDPAGHLPSWLNCVLFSPSYWHNIIHSSSPRPIIYFDISPWKEQILNSLRLVQDHVEGFSNTGNRYRIAKWLYRSAANITCGQIISKMSGSLEIVDEGWNGRIVIETEGTAEHAKALISRCAGPNASPQAKAALLATVMGDAKAALRAIKTNDTHGLTQSSFVSEPASKSSEIQNSPWMIMRERSRPGLIWIKLA